MLERIAAEVEGEEADAKKLSYRDVTRLSTATNLYLIIYLYSFVLTCTLQLDLFVLDLKLLKLFLQWDSVERPDLFSGFCFMKAGEGAGSFNKWKKVFLAERQDYNIDVFKTDKVYNLNH